MHISFCVIDFDKRRVIYMGLLTLVNNLPKQEIEEIVKKQIPSQFDAYSYAWIEHGEDTFPLKE